MSALVLSSLFGLLGPILAAFVVLSAVLGLSSSIASVDDPGVSRSSSSRQVEKSPDPVEQLYARLTLPVGEDLHGGVLMPWEGCVQTGPTTVRINFDVDHCRSPQYRAEVHETETTVQIDLYRGAIARGEQPASRATPRVGEPTWIACTDVRKCRFMEIETQAPIGDRGIIQQFQETPGITPARA